MNTPPRMHAAFIRRTGGVEEIEYGELPLPRPGPTDVLVRMLASAVNHVDLHVRSGAYPTHTPFPFVIGRDLVGVVAETGAGVDAFKSGDRVWTNSLGHHGRQGAFAEYAVVSSERLYPLPEGADVEQTAALLHAAGTAWLGLVREVALRAGETILIEGAGGAVGSATVQLASRMGARVLATASPADEAWVRSCGAERVLDYHQPDRHGQVRAIAPQGVDVWWDHSGHNDFTQCLPLMVMGGRVVVTSGLRGASSPVLPAGALYTRDIRLHGFAISNASVGDLQAAARAINGMLASGHLRARIGTRFRLADAARAHTAMAAGKTGGRIVVVP